MDLNSSWNDNGSRDYLQCYYLSNNIKELPPSVQHATKVDLCTNQH